MEEEIKALLNEIELMPGAIRLIKYLHDHNVPMAIATGSSSTSFWNKASNFEHVFKNSPYFEHIVFAGDDPAVKVRQLRSCDHSLLIQPHRKASQNRTCFWWRLNGSSRSRKI